MASLKENEKEEARQLYFTTSLSQAEIARRIGVSEKTMSAWAIEGDWRAVKKASFHSPKVEIQRLYEELRVISINISKRKPEERYPTKEELDARTRIIALINALGEVRDQWRNIYQDFELTTPTGYNNTPTETIPPQTSITQQ